MRQWKKILTIGITLFVLSFLSLYMLINIRGKEMLSKKLVESFNQKVAIESLYITFPATVHIKKMEVEGLFRADEVIAGIGLFDVFSKDLKLTSLKIIRPVVTIEKNPQGTVQKQAVSQEPNTQKAAADLSQPKPGASDKQPAVQQQPAVSVKQPVGLQQPVAGLLLYAFSKGRFIISDGTLDFIDRTAGDKELIIKIENVDLRVDNFTSGGRGIKLTSFELKGTIPWREQAEKGKLYAEGWINLAKKDIQATLKIEDIDGVYLHPYYSEWLDLEKLPIEKASLNFNSNIQGLNNNVTAECHLELTDIVRKPPAQGESLEREEKIATAVIDMFKTLDQGKIVLDFTVRTKLDKLEFGFGNIKMALQDKFAQARSSASVGPQGILVLPVRLVEGIVKGATDISKAMIDGTFAVGNEIKDSLEQSFKRKPE